MAGSDSSGARRRGRRVLDPEAGFAFYASLPPGRRSYGAVAAEFGCSARTVERYGRVGRWRERLRAIEVQARESFDQRLGEERAEDLAGVKRLLDASFASYGEQLASGRVRFSPAGFVAMVKLLVDQLAVPLATAEPVRGASEPSVEHKLDVLGGLHEAGAFATLEALFADRPVPGSGDDDAEGVGDDERTRGAERSSQHRVDGLEERDEPTGEEAAA